MLAGVVAVGSDVIARSDPTHTAALGLVAALIGALRLRLRGRGRTLTAAATAAFLAQPVLHATTKLLLTVPLGHGHEPLSHVFGEAPGAAVQVLVAAAIVMAVVAVESLVHRCLVARGTATGRAPVGVSREATVLPAAPDVDDRRARSGGLACPALRGPPSVGIPV